MTDTITTERTNDVGGIAGERLRSYVDRIERLEQEKQGIMDDIKGIYAESKGVGFEPKIIRTIIRLRKKAEQERREEEELLELYEAALGQ